MAAAFLKGLKFHMTGKPAETTQHQRWRCQCPPSCLLESPSEAGSYKVSSSHSQTVYTSPADCLVLQVSHLFLDGAGDKKKHGQQHLQFGKFDQSVLHKSIQEQDGNRNIGDFVKTHNLLR